MPVSGPRPSDAKYRGVILGAALGDALGWPYENRAKNASGAPTGSLTFRDWIKRSGGKFQPHEEHIPAGSYSDDTQLIIAVARSRLLQSRWWEYFSQVELPLWTVYEKGGGGATIRAAKSWIKGSAPWTLNRADADKYFNAGGNGAAMRIAPHVLANAELAFHSVAKDIASDSVITHGHPHAVVGALSYGYALWFAIRNAHTLEYGQLVKEVLDNKEAWANLPDFEDIWPGWRHTALDHNFESEWNIVVNAHLRQLAIASESLEAGALSVDQETLEAIGCFDKRILGAGTVASSAAIYLASRYAAGPMEGVAAAAFAKGADTDTIASMTGALSGAISGVDWTGSLARELQDYDFLLHISSILQDVKPNNEPFDAISQRFIDRFYRALDREGPLDLPVGFPRVVHPAEMVRSKSDNLRTRSWIINGHREQTIFVKKLERPRNQQPRETEQDAFEFDSVSAPRRDAEFAGIGLFAGNLERSKAFYGDVLGLPVLRVTPKLIQLGSHLVLRKSDESVVAGTGTVVYIQVPDIQRCAHALSRWKTGVSPIETNGNRRSLICHDPDGRTVEIFERRG